MGKALIIAEKPSVAGDIAKALGGFAKHDDYFESDQYVVSSAVGHLLELAVPEEFEIARGKWSFDKLPHIPPRFALKPIEKNENRLKVLQRLIKRKDVDSLINACDAGREGELIFRNIAAFTSAKQPVRRLWLQSMTPAAIREGFNQLRTDAQMRPLADASACRSESDWLVGINGTRAMTAFNSKTGGFHLTTVGRVQTPTLAIVVEREEKIRKFISRDYWEVIGTFAAQAGAYPGRWFDEKFSRGEGKDVELKPERLWDKARAEEIREKCLGKPGIVTEESKPSSQLSPLLYDLTSLQREANGRFGFSAKGTLGLAQALYEKHKALTYPRTDSRALPEDYLSTVKKTMDALAKVREFAPFAKQVLKSGWVKPNRRIFDNSKISDHFAIIPTLQTPGHLSEPEAKLYDLVVRRFLAVFFPPAEYLQTIRITTIGEEQFKTEGKVLQSPGWLAVYGKAAQEDDQNLPAIAQGENVRTLEADATANQTRPPARLNEATLLSAMEGAGKLVEDDELRAAMGAKGLGTPATRAAVIEGLIYEKYVERLGRELKPTWKAFRLFFALRHFGVDEITSPELTGDWEFKLKQMEQAKLPREKFMAHIEKVARDLVKRIKAGSIPEEAFATVAAPCPKCGGVIQETYRKFQCQSCDFYIWPVLLGRDWSPEDVAELVTKKFIGPLTGFRSKQGRPFSAGLKLTDDFRIEFDFGQADGTEGGEAPDFSGAEPLGNCPKCGSRVFELGVSYVCEKSVGKERSCDFRSGRMILQQPVERAQMQKLLATGRTDLLVNFISRKNRKFKAFLVKTPEGKVGFEFQARAPKPGQKEKKKIAQKPARKKRAA